MVDALRGRRLLDLSCGTGHTLAVLDDGDVYAWGRGNDGQLGDKAFVGPPRRVAALSESRARSPVAVAALGACSGAVFDDDDITLIGACARVGAALREALREKRAAAAPCRGAAYGETQLP